MSFSGFFLILGSFREEKYFFQVISETFPILQQSFEELDKTLQKYGLIKSILLSLHI